MYSTRSEGTSVVAKRLIKTSKSRIFMHMNEISKNMYIDRLDKIVDKHHGTLKMKSADVKPGMYIDYGVEHNKKDR